MKVKEKEKPTRFIESQANTNKKENYKSPKKETQIKKKIINHKKKRKRGKRKRVIYLHFFSHTIFFFSFLPNKGWVHSPAPPPQSGTHPPHYLFRNHIIHFSHFLPDLSVFHTLSLFFVSFSITRPNFLHTLSVSFSLSLSKSGAD